MVQQEFFEVYDIWYQPWWHSAWFQVVGVGLVVLLVLYMVYRWFKRPKVLTPFQKIMQELHRLRQLSSPSEIMLHDAYFRLTMAVKVYLATILHVQLLHKNDLEITGELHGNLPEDMVHLLQEFFDRSFHIKFAYDVPSETSLHQDIAMIESLIKELEIAHQGAKKH